MSKNHKSIRDIALKTVKGLRSEPHESALGDLFASFPELPAGALKPSPTPDSNLMRLIERIKKL